MSSNALFRLKSEYLSDEESDNEEHKPNPKDVSDQCLKQEVGSSIQSENKPDISADIKVDSKPDIVPQITPNMAVIGTDKRNDIKPDIVNDIQLNIMPEVVPKCMSVSVDTINGNENYHITQQPKDKFNEIDISSDSSSSSWSLSSDEELPEENDRKQTKTFVKTKGELSLEDLPPIENLTISVGVEELSQLGRVVSIVDQLVIVQSFRLMPALDLESVLFFKNGQPMGRIFDVFGPVVEPRYAVRFNDVQQIIDMNISVETPVYFAAQQKQPITGFVFAEQLRRMKGSDASWKHNNEPPEEMVEYSDDESERQHKKKSNSKRSYSQRNYHLSQNQNK